MRRLSVHAPEGALRRSLSMATLCALGLAACAPASIARRIENVAVISERAARQGALRCCAPEELALARVHLELARLELAQGEARQAGRHLTLAEPNAKAAVRLSEASSCCDPRTASNPARAPEGALRLAAREQELSSLLHEAWPARITSSSRLLGVVGEDSDLGRSAP